MVAGSNSATPVIQADAVVKLYGQFAALQGVSFTVGSGTVAAFLGPNGAGKSTTMRILTGYLAPSSGSVKVAGYDPTIPEQRLEMVRRLGYLPESGPLYGDMTPAEALRFIADVRKLANRTKAIGRVVQTCALSSVLHKPIRKLSKGFRQRVGMAQALLHDPDVLILDEPTSGLDPIQIRDVRSLIRELGRDKTILLSTHILQEVEAVADEVVMIHEGRICYAGAKSDMVGEGSLEERFYELSESSSS